MKAPRSEKEKEHYLEGIGDLFNKHYVEGLIQEMFMISLQHTVK